jgi:hypothetical protein
METRRPETLSTAMTARPWTKSFAGSEELSDPLRDILEDQIIVIELRKPNSRQMPHSRERSLTREREEEGTGGKNLNNIFFQFQ